MATAVQGGSGSRISELSRPKQVPPGFLEDRRSVYWVDYVPPRPGPSGTTAITATPRVSELARHRPPHRSWTGDRPSPMWAVSDQAKAASSSERIMVLSRHKSTHPEHKDEKSPYMNVTSNARTAHSTQRIEQLAEPRNRVDRFGTDETEWGQFYSPSAHAMQAGPRERTEQLAQAKPYHTQFRDERPVQWDVGNNALNAIATLRLQQLARPRSRTMIKDDFDPYKVSPSAKRARCTPRVDELCVPIPRKVRTKKNA